MKIKLLIKLLYIPVIFLMTGIVIPQEKRLVKLEQLINEKDWNNVDSLIISIDSLKKTPSQNALFTYYLGIRAFHKSNYINAFENLELSRNYFIKEGNIKYQALTEGVMIDCISYLNDPEISKEELIESFCELANELNDYNFQSDCLFYLGSQAFEKEDPNSGINYYKEISAFALENNDSIKYYNNQLNVAMLIGHYLKEPETSINIYNKLIPYFQQVHDTEREFLSNINLSIQYHTINQNKKAIQTLLKADSIDIKSDVLANKQLLNNYLSIYYESTNDISSSLNYLKISNTLKDSLKLIEQANAISDIQTKYQTAEKEKQILEEKSKNEQLTIENLKKEAKRKQSQTIATGLGSTLLLGSIIAFLVYRNIKRKQRIAEQDRELQIQKTETILKEKELETINAMVSGQEKERLRLASELHDNLGSTLATVRMQVENLERNLDKVDDPRALLQKTNALVNEAYTKVRSISHERNSGVLAKDGLLPAIQKLARTVSSNNNLQVDVQDFGLEDRIANELEITIFRIIQELVTNIIKHAQATEASISLTQHDNELNIMIEDNGKGFKVGKLKEKDGMGLGNIERRIEHLEGTMEVDSAIGRGTHISIDIPL